MQPQGLQARRDSRGIYLDPRTKLVLMVSVALIIPFGDASLRMNVIKCVLILLPSILLLLSNRIRQAFLCIGAYAIFTAISLLVLPRITGVPSMLLSACCVIFSRFLPSIMISWYLISTTTVSEFMAAMEKMHIPKALVIPLSVVFRFLPTVNEETASINDAMRMRGILLGSGGVGKFMEFRMVPVMICSLRIGEELSAAALTRGLGAPVRRTNICKIGFRFLDVIIILFCIASLTCLAFSGF